jgi:zinc transporter 9
MKSTSKGAVTSALVGNGALTVVKAIAFLLSGSGAMLSETIHSLADTGNQALLVLGIQRSRRPPDAAFPYGYGSDRFFYALMSAVGIFVLGCGVTVYHGIHNLIHPPELTFSWITFAVLGLSFVVEGSVLLVAVRVIWRNKGEESLFAYLGSTSDPTVVAVLLEDSVACVGVIVAAAAIGLSTWTGDPRYDAFGAILIGIMLGGVAAWLLAKNRALLLGPAIPAALQREIVGFLRAQPSVGRIGRARSRIVGADHFRLQAQIDFDGRHIGARLTDLVRERAGELEDAEGRRRFAEDFGERMLDELALEVDRIEAELAERFPRLKYVDLEAD